LIYDPLSYGGKQVGYPPLFHYFMGLFVRFIGLNIAFKLIPEILISLLVIVVFLIAKEISKNTNAALISSLMSGFIPLIFRETLNKASIYSLFLPMMFYMLYCFIKINDGNKYIIQFVILSILLPLVDPSSMIMLVTLLLYTILLVSESIEIINLRKETIFFSSFVIIVANFIIFRDVFYKYGVWVLKSTMPQSIYELLYREISLLALIYFLGILTLLFGIFGLYNGLFKERRISIFLISSLMLSVLLITITKFIDFANGLIFIGISLAILSSLAISKFFNYLELTKFNHTRNLFYVILIIGILIFSVYPSIKIADTNIKASLSEYDADALKFLRENTPEDSVIASRYNEGNLITSLANRKNVIDSYFLLTDDVEDRFKEINTLYSTPFIATAKEVVRKESINYIYLSEGTKEEFRITDLIYAKQDKTCFRNFYENDKTTIYQVIC
jgi:uncharacterized membrane protein